MENTTEFQIPGKEEAQIKENADVDYWSKEFDISKDDLNNDHNTVSILDKILKSYHQKAN